MKKQLILILLIFFALQTFSQEKILVADRKVSAKKDGIRLLYAFQKGDKVIISMTVEKGKDVKGVEFNVNGNILFSASDVGSFENKEFTMPETNFFNLDFWGPNIGSRDFELKIERIPASTDGKYFNTAIQQYKKYDTSYVAHEIDSVTGLKAPEYIPQTFRVISSIDYESTSLVQEKLNIKGVSKKYITVTRPQDTIITENKEMRLLGYQIIITSAAGATEMWKAIGVGVDIASMFFSPAAGIAAGTAFSMIAPQEGGEPVEYNIIKDEFDLNAFKDDDYKTTYSTYESGLVTGLSRTWNIWSDWNKFYIGLENLNIYAEIDVSVSVNAVYQATIYETITQNMIIVKPETVKLQREREVIENKKYYNYQN